MIIIVEKAAQFASGKSQSEAGSTQTTNDGFPGLQEVRAVAGRLLQAGFEEQLALETDALLGGLESVLIFDESAFAKKGAASAGVVFAEARMQLAESGISEPGYSRIPLQSIRTTAACRV
ncbi:MAG: hypothetical protein ACRER2_10920 [Methylococcales bacterium]